MGIRNSKKEVLCRLEHKTLDARFLQIVVEGLGCSPFEGEAVLSAVKEVYFPFLEAASPSAPPGKVTLVAVCADEPAGKPVAACEKRTVCLTVHRGAQDDRLLQEEGPQRADTGLVSRGAQPGRIADSGGPGCACVLREYADHLSRLGGLSHWGAGGAASVA
jgi:hypothetical protein